MSGNPVAAALKDLQDLDDRVREREAEKASASAARAALEAERTAAEAALAAARAALQECQKREKGREMELAAFEEKRDRLKAQLLAAKSNKEYAALQNEIKAFEADIGRMEEAGLADLAAIDAAAAAVAEREKALAAAEASLAARRREEEEIRARLDGEIRALRERWEERARAVEEGALSLYRRIAAGRDGVAVVPVENGSCGGCYMNLPPQSVNLLMGGRELVQCRSCQRILYLPGADKKEEGGSR